MMLAGWGRFPRFESKAVFGALPGGIPHAGGLGALVARGAGRAYGDAAIGLDATLFMNPLNRFLSFDENTSVLTVESGVLLSDIIDVFLPRGYFPPVVPGTRFVTAGGMVAANVHGKNHHRDGGFGAHVTRLSLACPDGKVRDCSATCEPELFRATIGGMGLTGVILDLSLRLIPVESAFIRQETIVAANLRAVLAAFEESHSWSYTVAWIDALATGAATGRSLFYRGEHAKRDEVGDMPARKISSRLQVPVDLPSQTLNRLSVTAFNKLHYLRGAAGARTRILPCHSYFFPLDSIGHWNRIYGKAGFLQHQCVVPKKMGEAALGELLEVVASRGSPSFLAVLKLLGPDHAGLMGFPMEGYTLALDFPASPRSLALLNELDRIVVRYGGRLYLAKDGRQSRSTLEAGYPAVENFRNFRHDIGADHRFQSRMSVRLGL